MDKPASQTTSEPQGQTASWKETLTMAGFFTLAFASAAMIVAMGSDAGNKSAKVNDAAAASLLSSQGYDVVKRRSFKTTQDETLQEATVGTYDIVERNTSEAFKATVTCGQILAPGAIMPRTCYSVIGPRK